MVMPVHPRGGGELRRDKRLSNDASGSSPRGRGTRIRHQTSTVRRRFIPAGAGNSNPITENGKTFAVHPRGGGELVLQGSERCSRGGSSPRGRGTLLGLRRVKVLRRFIPAGAGNSVAQMNVFPLFAVHPRGGGELWGWGCRPIAHNGSSPRGRGTHLCGGKGDEHVRFIPAGAGNSVGDWIVGMFRPVHPRGGGELMRSGA